MGNPAWRFDGNEHKYVKEVLSTGFRAGADGAFHSAKAVLNGSKAIVLCDAVPHPVSIRYAWLAGSVTNVFNTEGLPAIPFLINDIEKRK